MSKYLKTCLLSAFVFFSITATAQEWVKAQLIASHSVENGAVTSAKLANLSPAAIQKGLRDTQMLADVTFDEKTRVLTYKWHSLVKEVKGTEYAQALTEPLTSQVKAPVNVGGITAGQELIAKGDIESMLADFDLLLAKAQEPTEVDASSSLNQETNNELDNGGASSNGGSGNSGGGFLGDSGGLTENPQGDDLELGLDQIIEKVESCSMKVDLTNMVISQQERVVKTSSESGEIVEVGDCYNVGQASPIRKDFEAGCTLKVNKQNGEYIKGFKLYAMVEGSRYDVSECEWEDSDAISYDVMRDLDACSFDKAIINADRGIYYPAFVKYTVIDGKRFDLSECETVDTVNKELPTKIEQCENLNDLTANISYAQQRTDTYDPAFKTVLKKTSCSNTGVEYPIERDFEILQCSNLPDYTKKELYKGYKNYYTVSEKKTYIDGCNVDMENPIPIFQETENCRPTENLVDRIATINKRWAYLDATGKKEYITGCTESEEIYPIVTTENTCTPEYISSINKVILKDREGWQNSEGIWTYVTECRSNGSEQDILVEVCENPKYEHDYVGGSSYLRTRDYYVYNGVNKYLNDCSRDGSVSYPHFKETTGCTAANDDANLRTRLYQRTYANLDEGKTILKGCEASTSYVPYQLTASPSYPPISYTSSCSSFSAKTLVEFYNAFLASKNTYGTPTIWQPSSGDTSKTNCTYESGGDKVRSGIKQSGNITRTENRWRRMDGSIYVTDVKVTVSR